MIMTTVHLNLDDPHLDEQAIDPVLPEGWESMALQKVVSHKKGKKPKRLEEEKWEGAVPYIDIEAFETRHIKRYADPDSSVLVNEGDVVVVWDGARFGHVGRVPVHGALGSTLMNIKPIMIDPDYLLRFLQMSYETINSNPRGTGIPHVEPQLFWNLELPIAPFEEQKRIVAKVEELLARVNLVHERLTKVKKILKRFSQSALAAACSGRLTAEWRKSHTDITPAEVSIQEILSLREKQWAMENGPANKFRPPKNRKTNDLPDIPENWKYASSDALFLFITSGSRGWAKYYSKTGHTFLRVGNLDHDTINLDLSNTQYVDPPVGAERDRTQVRGGDILISITADVGMIGIVPDEIGEAYVNQHVAISRPVEGVYRPFLAWYLASPKGGQAQFQNLQRGATKVGLGLDDIRSVSVPFPPVEEQKEIVSRINTLFSLADGIEERVVAVIESTEGLTRAILAKAFRGELVPTEAELAQHEGRTYEPASDILAKIRTQRK